MASNLGPHPNQSVTLKNAASIFSTGTKLPKVLGYFLRGTIEAMFGLHGLRLHRQHGYFGCDRRNPRGDLSYA